MTYKLEPEIEFLRHNPEMQARISIAISLKRIADKLELLIELMAEDQSTGDEDLDAIRKKYGSV
jgi:hypothetical protein